MLAPNAESKEAYAAQCQNYEAFNPNGLAGKRGEEMGGEPEAREHGNVDFGLGEKPEEALPKHRKKIRDKTCGLTGKKIQRWKKVRARKAIR